MIEEFKKYFPDEDLYQIFNNIIGITRPKKQLIDKVLRHPSHLHICFKLNGKHAILDCLQEVQKSKQHKPVIRGLSIEVLKN
jgi:hypothetical protein